METSKNKDDITYAEEVVVIIGSILPGIDGLHPNTYGKVKNPGSQLVLVPDPKLFLMWFTFSAAHREESFLQVILEAINICTH